MQMSKNYAAQTFEGPTILNIFQYALRLSRALYGKYFHNIRLISHQNVFFKYRRSTEIFLIDIPHNVARAVKCTGYQYNAEGEKKPAG